MDADAILSQFGEKPKSSVGKSTFDVNSILSDFGVKEDKVTLSGKPSAITVTKPPISGISKESSDELNQTRAEKFGGENPRSKLPTTSIQESAYEADRAGKEMLSSGIEDFSSGHPYKGAAKVIGGTLSRAFSPLTGIIEGGIEKPITDVTGNERIGKSAGFIAGSVIPVGKTGKAVNAARPTNKALSTLIENIGQENLPAVVSAMKANPRLAPADLSPRVLQDTQHLFANDGPQINYLANRSAERMATRKSTIEEAYDASAGVSPNLAKKISDLAQTAKDVGSKQINPIVAASGPVNISSTLTAIDDVLKPGVLKIGDSVPLTAVKKELENIRRSLRTSKEYDAKDLHSFQSGLRKTAESLLKSATGNDKEIGQALMKVRNSLVSDIDKASPKAKATPDEILKQKGFSDKQIEELGTGKLRDKTIEIFEKANGGPILSKDRGSYKDALHSYRDEMHIADAFKQGHDNIFSSSKKIENDPSFTKKWFNGLSEHEQQAAREGARTAIYTEMGVAKNPALAGESIARSDFNKAKMEILFGKEETETLLKKLSDERTIANTHNKIIEGSQTAMRTASKSQFTLPTHTDVLKSAPAVAAAETASYFMGGYPLVGSAVLGAAKMGNAVKDTIKLKLAREHNAQYAKLALPTEGPSRDALIQSLEAAIPGPKQSMLTRGANTLSRLVSP